MHLPSTPPAAGAPGAARVWVWLLALAITMLVLGAFALVSLTTSAELFMVILGWLLVAGGALELLRAFLFRAYGSFGFELLIGALSIVLGAFMITTPIGAGSLFALMIVVGLLAELLIGGVGALRARRRGWIWPVLLAVLGLALGIVIIANPSLLLVLLGLLVSVELLVRGLLLLLTALEVRQLSR